MSMWFPFNAEQWQDINRELSENQNFWSPNSYALMAQAKTLRERVFARIFSLLINETEIKFAHQGITYKLELKQKGLRGLMAACKRSPKVRKVLSRIPFAQRTTVTRGDPEIHACLQDLADIVCWEASEAFNNSYFPRPVDVDPLSDDHVKEISVAMQREMDREGNRTGKKPAVFVDLPWERQVALAERRRWWFCFAAGTRVFKSDLTWAPIETLKAGDELLTLDEYGEGKAKSKRKWRYTKVVGASSRLAKVVKIHLKDGSSLVVTDDHPILTYSKRFCLPKNFKWKGKTTTKLAKLLEPWETDNSREAGWLAGFFDGEGCLSLGRGIALSVAQTHNAALSLVKNILQAKNFPLQVMQPPRKSSLGTKPVEVLRLSGSRTRKEILRFIGSIRPVRLLEKFKMPRLHMWASPIEVEKVEKTGLVVPVYNIETTAGTYIAEGFLVHNCQFGVTPKRWKKGYFSLWKVSNTLTWPPDGYYCAWDKIVVDG